MPFEEFVRDSPTPDGKFLVSATLQESKEYGVATPPNNGAVVIVTPPPPAQVKLSLTKEIVGRNPRNGSFEFDIDSISSVAGAPTSPITLQTQAVEIGEGFTRTVYRSEKFADIPVVAGRTVTNTELPVAGFTPDRAECQFQDGEQRSFPLTAENRSFELMVEAGNNIDCTVFNRADPQFGTLSLIKQINEVNARGGTFTFELTGADYLVSPNMLVGVLVQYDYLSDESKSRGRDGYDISGHGWMAGPYVEVAISKNLIFDGKALWGTSRNTVSPDLTFTDSFTTERWLASARLTGSWTSAQSATSSWHFAPQAEVVWFDEKSAGFTNTLGVDINSQHVRLGRFKAGPEISYRHRMANGTVIEPRVGAQALWRFTGAGNANAPDFDTASSDALASVPLEKFQMRFEGGLKIETAQGTRFEVQGAYTGLGRQGQETIGGKVGVTIPLQ
ncbi:MAG: autotransporter outer membrane beta-barrel domain-containing protein [Hyphomicrobiaceae bacterium]